MCLQLQTCDVLHCGIVKDQHQGSDLAIHFTSIGPKLLGNATTPLRQMGHLSIDNGINGMVLVPFTDDPTVASTVFGGVVIGAGMPGILLVANLTGTAHAPVLTYTGSINLSDAAVCTQGGGCTVGMLPYGYRIAFG